MELHERELCSGCLGYLPLIACDAIHSYLVGHCIITVVNSAKKHDIPIPLSGWMAYNVKRDSETLK